MKKIRVGIVGSGDVAKALGNGYIGLGHDVRLGTRSPEKLAEWAAKAGDHASVGSFAEAAAFGDVIVLATFGMATEEAIRMAGVGNFSGKVVIDTTNPLEFSSGRPELAIGHTDSLGERIQRLVPSARVVKAYNTVGNALMVNPPFSEGRPDMFICGNDDDAKKVVSQMCEHFGWGVIDIGDIAASRYLEPMCLVWVLHAIRTGSGNHAFKMLHK